MIILLTGATGFLGRHIYRILLSSGYDVRPTCGRLVNLLDRDETDLLLENTKPDCLIANAWMAVPKIFWDDPSNPMWAASTERLIRRFYDGGGKRCIFVSSDAALNHLDTPYGKSKNRVEGFLANYPNSVTFRVGYPRGNAEALRFAEQIAGLVDTTTDLAAIHRRFYDDLEARWRQQRA